MKPLLKRPNNEIDLTRNVEGEICNKDNFPTFSKALEERVSFLKEFLQEILQMICIKFLIVIG